MKLFIRKFSACCPHQQGRHMTQANQSEFFSRNWFGSWESSKGDLSPRHWIKVHFSIFLFLSYGWERVHFPFCTNIIPYTTTFSGLFSSRKVLLPSQASTSRKHYLTALQWHMKPKAARGWLLSQHTNGKTNNQNHSFGQKKKKKKKFNHHHK